MPSSFFALAHDSLMVAVMILLFVWAALMLVSRRRWANPASMCIRPALLLRLLSLALVASVFPLLLSSSLSCVTKGTQC